MKERQIHNIQNARYEKAYRVDGNECHIVVEDAVFGEYKGKMELLDKTIVDDMCKDIMKVLSMHVSKYNSFPEKISIIHEQHNEHQENQQSTIFETYDPKVNFDDIALTVSVKRQLEITISAIKNKQKLCEEWGLSGSGMDKRAIILNFYGKPGTGKSMTAEGIARYLGKKVLRVNYSELESKYVGETPKNIRTAFMEAKREDAVLIFDEADSFLSSRLKNITQAADYGVNITRSVMLMELEQYDGIVVFTTNLIKNYDTAFKRRIFASIEFLLPDAKAREKIWKVHISDKLPIVKEITMKSLAERYHEVSGADIKDIIFYAALIAVEAGQNELTFDNFDEAYKYVMNRYQETELC